MTQGSPESGRDLGLEDAHSLLSAGDPGPTPFLVEGFIVLNAIAALVGAYKVGKTWIVLAIALAVASGEAFLGRFKVARGPVMLILEESGRRALHRRLAMMVRGQGIAHHKLSQLFFAANQGVKLTDPEWRAQILSEAQRIQPMLIVFDPLARVKGGSVDENSQLEMGPVLDFLRELREVSGAAILFVQHTGHEAGGRMRGTSDLEAYWESKVTITRDSDALQIRADHREAESTEPVGYRLDFDDHGMRFDLDEAQDDHDALILDYLAEHPQSTNTEVREGVPRRASATTSRLLALERAGTVGRRQSERPDKAGRARRVDVFFLTENADLEPVPDPGHAGTTNGSGSGSVSPLSGAFYRGGHGTGWTTWGRRHETPARTPASTPSCRLLVKRVAEVCVRCPDTKLRRLRRALPRAPGRPRLRAGTDRSLRR
ncbi:MAG: AAA family ATPase [Thermoleophilales bacterium]|nr:AAA family ATPase [Thermoleophilales bacterium]